MTSGASCLTLVVICWRSALAVGFAWSGSILCWSDVLGKRLAEAPVRSTASICADFCAILIALLMSFSLSDLASATTL